MDNPYMRSTKNWDLWREGFKLEQVHSKGIDGDQATDV